MKASPQDNIHSILKAYLSSPPRSTPQGDQIRFNRGGEPSVFGPAIKAEPQLHQPRRDEVHLKATLRSGNLHFKSRLQPWTRQYNLFIDDSPSLSHTINSLSLQQMIEGFQLWCKKHHCSEYIFRCSEVPDHSWGNHLWSAWNNLDQKWAGAHNIVISDFHGPIPNGPFWLQLLARSQVTFIWIQHPLPNFKEGEPLLDNESPQDTSTLTWNKNTFQKNYQQWIKELQTFFKKSSALCLKAHSIENLINELFFTLTGQKKQKA